MRDNFKCQYCGKDCLESMETWHGITHDHFIPRKHGGADDEDNIITSCSHCNSIKGGKKFANFEEAKQCILKRKKEIEIEFEKVKAFIAARR